MPQFAPGLRRVLAARKPAAPKQKLELRQEWACVPLRAPFLAPFRIEKRQPLFNRVMLTEVVASKNPLPVKIHSLRGTLPTLQIASSDVWWPPSPQRHISRHHHEYRFHHSRPRLLPPSCLHPRSDEPAKQGGVSPVHCCPTQRPTSAGQPRRTRRTRKHSCLCGRAMITIRAVRRPALAGRPIGGRPFGARRVSAKPEIDRSDSPPRVRHARSVTFAPAMPVHAAIAGVGIGHYSRRRHQGKSEERFPARGAAAGDGRPASRRRSSFSSWLRGFVASETFVSTDSEARRPHDTRRCSCWERSAPCRRSSTPCTSRAACTSTSTSSRTRDTSSPRHHAPLRVAG